MLTDDERTLQVLEDVATNGFRRPDPFDFGRCFRNGLCRVRWVVPEYSEYGDRVAVRILTPAGRAELARLRKLKEVSGE